MTAMNAKDEKPAPVKVDLLETGPDLTIEKLEQWFERILGRPITEEERERGRAKLAGKFPTEGESK